MRENCTGSRHFLNLFTKHFNITALALKRKGKSYQHAVADGYFRNLVHDDQKLFFLVQQHLTSVFFSSLSCPVCQHHLSLSR